MKVYTEIVIDMQTNEVLHEESFDYNGPTAELKGGGGDAVDEEYNARMATIAESQQGMSEEMFNFYKYGSLEPPGAQYNVGGEWLSEDEAREFLNQDPDAIRQAESDFLSGLPSRMKRGTKYDPQGGGKQYKVNGQWVDRNTALGHYNHSADLSGYDIRSTGDNDQTSYLDLEKMKIGANADLIPLQTDLEKSNIGLQQAQIGAAMDSSIWGGGGGSSSGGGLATSQTLRRPVLQTSGDPDAVVQSHYQNLFGRAPQDEGLQFWQNQLESGAIDEGELRQRMLDAASESDLQAYENRPTGGGSGPGLQPSGENQFTHEARLRKAQIGLGRDVIGAKRQMLPQVQGLMTGYLSDANDGLDVQEQMGKAQTDVSAAYQGAGGNLRRSASRMGLNPNSGKFTNAMNDLNMKRARDIAGARTQERRATEQENFRRKGQASQLGLSIYG